MNETNTEYHQPQRQDDEIDLAELFLILWKRKTLIAGVTIVATIAAISVTMMLQEVYKITSVLEVGTYMHKEEEEMVPTPLQDPQNIKANIVNGSYTQSIARKLDLPTGKMPQFNVTVPANTALLTISIESSTPQRAVQIQNVLLETLQAELQDIMKFKAGELRAKIKKALGKTNQLQKQTEIVSTQIALLREELSELEQQRRNLVEKKQDNTLETLLFSNEIQNRRDSLKEQRQQLIDYNSQRDEYIMESEQFKEHLKAMQASVISQEPTIPNSPVQPRKTLIIALTFMIGLMVSVMLAFMVEFITNIRYRTKSGKN